MTHSVREPRWKSTGLRLIVLTVAVALGACARPQRTAPSQPRYPSVAAKQVPDYLKGTILERVDVGNTAGKRVSGYGLVANLWQTGDAKASNAVREYMVREMVRGGFGSKQLGYDDITPERVLRDPRFAIVRVEGLIPPGAQVMDRFDVVVAAEDINDTTSLAHGQLYRTVMKENGADPRNPGMAIDKWAIAEGGIFVNPTYALEVKPTSGAARASLRNGVIIGGGIVQIERPLILRLRQPGFREARAIDHRLDLFLQDSSIASAKNEAVIEVRLPPRFGGDWEHFVGLITHVYFNDSPTFRVNKAKELAIVALRPDAPLMDISYCWEALGEDALPFVAPLMTHDRPDVAYAAARAAAFSGDMAAHSVLIDMARRPDHAFQLNAVQSLGKLPPSPEINAMLRTLLGSEQTLVRLEAYRALARAGDPSIYTKIVPDARVQKFALDIVPADGPPLIYASRRGIPRLAIFGRKPTLALPLTFTAMDGQLSISSGPGNKTVTIFYRGPGVRRPVKIESNPDIAEVAARLGGAGPIDEPNLHFNYCDVVAVVQALADQQKIVMPSPPTAANGERTTVAFVLQDAPHDDESIFETEPDPDAAPEQRQRPQTAGSSGTVSDARPLAGGNAK